MKLSPRSCPGDLYACRLVYDVDGGITLKVLRRVGWQIGFECDSFHFCLTNNSRDSYSVLKIKGLLV